MNKRWQIGVRLSFFKLNRILFESRAVIFLKMTVNSNNNFWQVFSKFSHKSSNHWRDGCATKSRKLLVITALVWYLLSHSSRKLKEKRLFFWVFSNWFLRLENSFSHSRSPQNQLIWHLKESLSYRLSHSIRYD